MTSRDRAQQPTAHERRAGAPGCVVPRRPSALGHRPAAAGSHASRIGRWIRGPMLDAGCRTGENALHVASLGFAVLGRLLTGFHDGDSAPAWLATITRI